MKYVWIPMNPRMIKAPVTSQRLAGWNFPVTQDLSIIFLDSGWTGGSHGVSHLTQGSSGTPSKWTNRWKHSLVASQNPVVPFRSQTLFGSGCRGSHEVLLGMHPLDQLFWLTTCPSTQRLTGRQEPSAIRCCLRLSRVEGHGIASHSSSSAFSLNPGVHSSAIWQRLAGPVLVGVVRVARDFDGDCPGRRGSGGVLVVYGHGERVISGGNGDYEFAGILVNPFVVFTVYSFSLSDVPSDDGFQRFCPGR
jgi:hypothetical protein